jgi:hypothetical protein
MQKIPTCFQRGADHFVTGVITRGCEWVLAGEGIPTRKWDGTCTMFDGTSWWARREVQPGKPSPANFRPIGADDTTGRTVGWEPIEQSGFAKWHAEAVTDQEAIDDPEYATYLGAHGTFELIGPKVNRGPDGHPCHALIRHGVHVVDLSALGGESPTPQGLIRFCQAEGWEGIVWHHPDGRMAKLKVRDFPRPTGGSAA